ncbi:MAG: hypothetical protein JNN30_10975 [Rhodanobacteraceae bacterium]|nr:hypothetical protein [Rhodanobacteraceae bacterium]
MSALCAAPVGRWLDGGRGVLLMRVGALAAAGLLLAWSYVAGIAALYLVWAGLGACMALVLYETAFALVTRAFDDTAARVRALAGVTVMGGLASTLFLPLVGMGVGYWGWRITLRVLVVVWLLTAWLIHKSALPWLHTSDGMRSASGGVGAAGGSSVIDRRLLWLTGTPFVVATFATLGLTTLAIPHLVARGHPIEYAAYVLAALGVMQLPGRIWLLRGNGRALPLRGLIVAPLVLQALGLALLYAVGSLPAAVLAVALFGAGAGLHTLVRPVVVPILFGVGMAARAGGSIARAQGAARAAGPFAAATAAGWMGSSAVFLVLCLLLLACASLAQALSAHPRLRAGPEC